MTDFGSRQDFNDLASAIQRNKAVHLQPDVFEMFHQVLHEARDALPSPPTRLVGAPAKMIAAARGRVR